jgi:hypothetical protein
MLLLVNYLRRLMPHEHVAWWQWLFSGLSGVVFLPLVYGGDWLQYRLASSISIDSQGIKFANRGRPLSWWRPTRCELAADEFYPQLTHFRVYCRPPLGRKEMVMFCALLSDVSEAQRFIDIFREVYQRELTP